MVHLFRCGLHPLLGGANEVARFLPASEIAAAGRYRTDLLRRRYITTRWVVRTILSGFTNESPSHMAFRCTEWGKPVLADHGQIQFNYSHCEDELLVGVTQGTPVGVDVERIRNEFPADSVVDQFFSPAERAEFRSLGPSVRTDAFYAGWTRKEAFVKALGVGLSYGLDQFDVTLDPRRPARLLRAAGHDATEWTLQSIDFGSGFAAALAAQATNVEIQTCQFQDWP